MFALRVYYFVFHQIEVLGVMVCYECLHYGGRRDVLEVRSGSFALRGTLTAYHRLGVGKGKGVLSWCSERNETRFRH